MSKLVPAAGDDAYVSIDFGGRTYTVDQRDTVFITSWLSSLDPSDPAVGCWVEHGLGRIEACRQLVFRISRYLDLPGARALDVGCQTGALLIALGAMEAHACGVEPTVHALEAARRRTRDWGLPASLTASVGEALPFREEAFDLVTLIDVLEHVSDIQETLREAVRVLRPGGALVIQAPNRFSPQWFLRDPHYGLFGVSIFRGSMVRRYVEWRRGRPGYDVGVFPVGIRIVAELERLGCQSQVLTGRLVASLIKGKANNAAVAVLKYMQLTIGSLFTIVATKT